MKEIHITMPIALNHGWNSGADQAVIPEK